MNVIFRLPEYMFGGWIEREQGSEKERGDKEDEGQAPLTFIRIYTAWPGTG